MAYPSRFALSLLLLIVACGDDDPGLGTGTPTDTDGTSTGTEPSSTDAVDPDSTSTGEEAWAEICDGSEGLRLAVALTGGGTVDNEIIRELGFRYLYVAGTCEYWVLPSASAAGAPWPDTRTGVLDAEAEEALSRALDYGHLAQIAGHWDTPSLQDGATLLVSDGTQTMACYGGCEEGPAGAQALWEAEQELIDTLWESSEPWPGPMRISVLGWANSELDELPMPWPLPQDPWSIAIDGDTDPEPGPGHTVLIDDPQQAADLREIRRQYREDDLPEGVPNALQAYGHLSYTMAGGQDLFQLWMRDAIPLEGEDGLVALP